MRAEQVRERFPDFDTSDVDRWVGVPLGGGQLREPVAASDVRRWVQGMQNVNPLHWDDAFAAESRFGRLVAPQSFAVCCSDSHGAGPAIQGHIPGTHMLFGGDEWWFFGPRIFPGDRLRLDRMLFDYKVTETRFAGPTMFSRGDTTYVNQRGEVVAKQRSTSIRYRPEEARRRAEPDATPEHQWSDAELAELEERKLAYCASVHELGHERRLGVSKGDRLPTAVIGPHTIQSFTTEWRAFLMSAWGTFEPDGLPSSLWSAGWLPEMDRDHEKARLDPAQADGLYKGPSRGHVQARYAQLIGMPRGYGYGASMGAWILDWLGNWAGEWGEVVHSRASYRAPALTGDVTFLDGRVAETGRDEATGQPVARVELRMANQRDEVMATGTAEVRLPAD